MAVVSPFTSAEALRSMPGVPIEKLMQADFMLSSYNSMMARAANTLQLNVHLSSEDKSFFVKSYPDRFFEFSLNGEAGSGFADACHVSALWNERRQRTVPDLTVGFAADTTRLFDVCVSPMSPSDILSELALSRANKAVVIFPAGPMPAGESYKVRVGDSHVRFENDVGREVYESLPMAAWIEWSCILKNLGLREDIAEFASVSVRRRGCVAVAELVIKPGFRARGKVEAIAQSSSARPELPSVPGLLCPYTVTGDEKAILREHYAGLELVFTDRRLHDHPVAANLRAVDLQRINADLIQRGVIPPDRCAADAVRDSVETPGSDLWEPGRDHVAITVARQMRILSSIDKDARGNTILQLYREKQLHPGVMGLCYLRMYEKKKWLSVALIYGFYPQANRLSFQQHAACGTVVYIEDDGNGMLHVGTKPVNGAKFVMVNERLLFTGSEIMGDPRSVSVTSDFAIDDSWATVEFASCVADLRRELVRAEAIGYQVKVTPEVADGLNNLTRERTEDVEETSFHAVYALVMPMIGIDSRLRRQGFCRDLAVSLPIVDLADEVMLVPPEDRQTGDLLRVPRRRDAERTLPDGMGWPPVAVWSLRVTCYATAVIFLIMWFEAFPLLVVIFMLARAAVYNHTEGTVLLRL